MFKNKLITAILALAACATMLTACGGNGATTSSGSETKAPATTTEKTTEKNDTNIINDMNNGVERGRTGLKNGIENS